MKKFFQIIGVISILIFSFYYTDKIAVIVQSKNPILKNIKEKKDEYTVSSIDATIEDDYIIPGLAGSVVNVEKSFIKMKNKNIYDEYDLVFDEITPKVSLENNKDKIIISGNKQKKQVAIIIEYNKNLINYFENYNVNLLINKEQYSNDYNLELINNEINSKLYKQVNLLLDKDKLNKNLCLYNENNKDLCLKSNNYLIKPSLTLTSSSIIEVKNNIENGSIILIKDNAKLEDVKILLKQIKFHDLEIVYLSELIKE